MQRAKGKISTQLIFALYLLASCHLPFFNLIPPNIREKHKCKRDQDGING